MNRTLKASLAALLALFMGAFAFTGCVVVEDDYVCDDGEILFEAGDVSCDGYVDCLDGSDEYYCAADYVCDDGEVLYGYGDVSCDGTIDCYDGSDEVGCGAADYTCADGEILTATGDISCDDVADCTDLSDELACGACLTDEIICLVDGFEACAPICDDIIDCDSGIDEDVDACL